ncbi:DNA helicase/exodeoxyribonuclease V beta subunit [Chitinophaga niastensis]|uniref:RecBCD enzyme subunit RecB n=1 Tax=Chitinophaga niastensis TaxID=536980 RepID=A0A2P8HTD6_CHINA|nr:exodeoxyribonuclease V subunit beta [Chitinophaga niastensis]PSL49486.1 DNA helicase/exodeoxyribonuclease V beta subunit [Chitinophaga niastensis]
MIDIDKYKKFEAATVPLEGSNLIEASAGTGKTYSIAILVLRLILEQKLSIKEILMVTFTKAAVAELEERIRLFIRQAYKVSMGQPIKDENIMDVVLNVIDLDNPTPVQQQLRDAILLLDETAVLTIHSFCQQTLNEFAFETNQLFGAEMVPDITPVIEDELNKFWRKNVTTLPIALLEKIWYEEMRTDIQQVLQEHLSGKKYIGFNEDDNYDISLSQQDDWITILNDLAAKELQAQESLHSYITANAADLRNTCESNTHAKKALSGLIATPAAFVAEIEKKRSAGYIQKLFPEILDQSDSVNDISSALRELIASIRRQLCCMAIKEVGEGVHGFKERSNMLSYDDLISNLHNALVKRDNPQLTEVLQQKYKAVFVDEFQDTDRQQFEIFDKAFGQNTILFYIGDPKQSIYAWRKADISTYFNARNGVQHLYSMNHNFRSAENMVTAMNCFFKPVAGFDTFDFAGESDSIEYINVDSPLDNNKGHLFKGDHKAVPITVFTSSNKDQISEAVAAQAALLLQDSAYRIVNDKGARRITPADIGILVRTGKEGKSVKDKLAQLGIPAVTIDDAKVLDSPEAPQVLHLLEAMETPDRSTINRALLSSFTGFDIHTILLLDDEATITLFGKYRDLWQQDGAYTAIMEFITDFGVRNTLLEVHPANGERIITNLYQLTELVHQVQSRKNLSMRDLISWLKRGIDGMATEGDEYAQRVESDEEAVNIVTIHKSKGLEYKIVMAPFLDFVENSKAKFVSFRDPDTGDYLLAEKDRLTETQLATYQQQLEQENRRLIYVAITRAVYKCYLFKNNKKSSLTTFLDTLKESLPDPDIIQLQGITPEKPEQGYRKSVQRSGITTHHGPVYFHLQEENWRKMSYTMLAAKPEHRPRIRSFQQEDPYDNFIFNTLRRGAKTGNLLHFIFESINFSDNSKWEQWLEEAIRRFVPGQRDIYLPRLHEMLQHVFHTTINIDGTRFQLGSIGRNKRLAEFEFDFPVPVFPSNALNSLSDDLLTVNVRRFSEYSNQELEGIMNGKIDLFFEHADKYYILDWKSNYLGNSVTDYDTDALAAAMNENNYHLQYLIYTVAVKKYLESRIPGFDYETQFGGVIYCFVRGVRNTSNNGIFTTKPSIEKIVLLESLLTK